MLAKFYKNLIIFHLEIKKKIHILRFYYFQLCEIFDRKRMQLK